MLYKAAIRRRLENQPNLTLFQQAVDDLMRRGRPRRRRGDAGRHSLPRARRGADGRHVPGRARSTSASTITRPAAPAIRRPIALAARLQRAEAAAGPAEDRHAAAHRRPHASTSRKLRGAARRLDPVPVFSASSGDAAHASAPGAVLDHAHQRAHARDHPRRLRPLADVHRRDRRRGPALLPVDRGQDQALRRQGQRTRSSSSRKA